MRIALIALTLAAGTAVAVAASPDLREVAIASLRSLADPLLQRGESTTPNFDQFYAGMVEELPAQVRVEKALELAVNRYKGAPEYVIEKAAGWSGEFERSQRLEGLINTAINSPLLEVRMAGFEIYLAQFQLDKSSAQVERLVGRLAKDPVGNGPWALWSLGILGARGVDRERIYAELLTASADRSETIRRWAVDALARLGGVEVVDPLIDIGLSDPSTLVRERAFCGVAMSGTLLLAERYEAVPRLLAIVESPTSDQQTRSWAYQALREISSQYDLAEEPAAWRDRLSRLGLLLPAEALPR